MAVILPPPSYMDGLRADLESLFVERMSLHRSHPRQDEIRDEIDAIYAKMEAYSGPPKKADA